MRKEEKHHFYISHLSKTAKLNLSFDVSENVSS